MKTKLFKWPLFPGYLGYIQACDVTSVQMAKLADRWNIRPSPDHFYVPFDCNDDMGMCYKMNHNSIIVMADCDEDPGVLVHECLHAASNLVNGVGCHDEETLCHLTQWAFTTLLPYWSNEK